MGCGTIGWGCLRRDERLVAGWQWRVWFLFHGVALKELVLVHSGRYGDVEEAHHHFIVGLVSPGHRAVWVGIVRIVGGIVVPRDGLQLGTGLDEAGLSQAVAQLPIKIVVHPKQSFTGMTAIDEVVFETLATEMHVRKETEQGGIVRKSAVNFDTIIVSVGRNRDGIVVIGKLQGQDPPAGRMFGKDQTHAGLILARLATRGVVHLEYEIGMRGNELGR